MFWFEKNHDRLLVDVDDDNDIDDDDDYDDVMVVMMVVDGYTVSAKQLYRNLSIIMVLIWKWREHKTQNIWT